MNNRPALRDTRNLDLDYMPTMDSEIFYTGKQSTYTYHTYISIISCNGVKSLQHKLRLRKELQSGCVGCHKHRAIGDTPIKHNDHGHAFLVSVFDLHSYRATSLLGDALLSPSDIDGWRGRHFNHDA